MIFILRRIYTERIIAYNTYYIDLAVCALKIFQYITDYFTPRGVNQCDQIWRFFKVPVQNYDAKVDQTNCDFWAILKTSRFT